MKVLLSRTSFSLWSIVVSAIMLLNNSVVVAVDNDTRSISQTSVNITTDTGGEQIQSTTVRIDRADLRQPQILRVQGSRNMAQVDVKINGKLVKSIENGSIELNLAPMMMAGSNQVEIFGTSPDIDDTISMSFIGTNTNVNQQSSGYGSIRKLLVINVQ
jgi:hypothetical protein